MRFAAVQHDIAWMDPAPNWERIGNLLADARLPAGSFALLPELCDVGFTMETDRLPRFDSVGAARGLARSHALWLQAGYADLGVNAERPTNRAAIIAPDGRVAGAYDKVHLFSPGREDRHYAAGRSITVVDVPSDQGTWKVCPLICYDLRFPEVFRLAALAGAEVFTVGANWPAPRALHRRALAVARAIENQAYVIACNRIGRDPHVEYAGDSFIVAPSGEVIAEAGDAERVISVELDRAELLRWRERFPALRDLRRGLLGEIAVDATSRDSRADD